MYYAIAMIAFVVVIIVVISIGSKRNANATKRMSDEQLKQKFTYCAEQIAMRASVSGLTGLGSRMVTNKHNEDIAVFRAEGMRCAEELAARGYTVNVSVLNGSCTRGKSSSSVIGSAIVGGVIAGAPGAIIGAIHASNQNNK